MTYGWAEEASGHRLAKAGDRNRSRRSGTRLLALFRVWSKRRRHRQHLAEISALGDRTMLDLGFDPDIVRVEAAKPFWRP